MPGLQDIFDEGKRDRKRKGRLGSRLGFDGSVVDPRDFNIVLPIDPQTRKKRSGRPKGRHNKTFREHYGF